MPRDIKKLKELQEIINRKDLKIAKYEQLISSINGLIAINGIKINEDNYKEFLAYNDIGRDRKAETYKLSKEELAEALGSRLNKDGYKLLIVKNNDKETQEAINKAVFKQPKQEPINYDNEMPSKEEIREKAEETEEKTKKRKSKGKIPTNINEVLEQEREKATEATAIADQNKPLEERIKELPAEAKALIEANKARAAAAAKEKIHGIEGDREYERLTKKEQQEKGEIPSTGNCPHCGEVLEAPIIRGYHDICWEAKQKKEVNN